MLSQMPCRGLDGEHNLIVLFTGLSNNEVSFTCTCVYIHMSYVLELLK